MFQLFSDVYWTKVFELLPGLSGNLQKLILAVPGHNNVAGTMPMTLVSAYFLVDQCSKLKVLGNILSWKVLPSTGDANLEERMENYQTFVNHCKTRGVDVMNEKTRMH